MGRYRCISLGMIPVSAVPGVSLVPVVFRLLSAHEPANWRVSYRADRDGGIGLKWHEAGT
jgi:hypothetical protein